MKNKLTFAATFILVLGMMSCSSPLKMKKAAKDVAVTCTPIPLEIKGNVIEAEWTATFPEKYFNKKAGLQLLPVLVYQGGEATGAVKRLQGEKVLDNYEVIKNTGGKASQKLKFDYVPGMEKCHLELRAKLLYKDKEYDFDEPYPLADGAVATALLVDKSGVVELQKDDYKKFTYSQKDAQIKYDWNKSNVKKDQLSKEDIKELKAFVDNAIADGNKVEYQGMEISAYASPEGKYERNETLSNERGKTANDAFNKLYTKKETQPSGNIEMKYTAEDWDGFQKLVSESNIDDKDLILRVLSMYQDPVVREKEIRNMSKVFSVLEQKVLPELRRSVLTAKIKVNNYSDEELLALVGTDGINSLDADALLYAATLLKDDDYETKSKIYKKAADKYEDERAINNYAAMLLKQGKTDEAKKALDAVNKKNSEIFNNLGIAQLSSGNTTDAAKSFAQANSTAAKQNLAAVAIINGDYKSAATTLEGTNSLNEALAKYLNNNLNGAKSVLEKVKDTTGKASYLKALIAVKEGNTSNIASYLSDAFAKDATLKAKAQNDISFEKVKNLIP
ncbi:MAG: tetratricopeptide repeat protein [Prevotellaceae bacterium]|jgi:Flp pilus assembly protein TadD|nr:tetratricopeptide repeat protein [Prevotellaceae bacterium]